jgi:hypothetical protein
MLTRWGSSQTTAERSTIPPEKKSVPYIMAVELKKKIVFDSKNYRSTETALFTGKILGDRQDEQNKNT